MSDIPIQYFGKPYVLKPGLVIFRFAGKSYVTENNIKLIGLSEIRQWVYQIIYEKWNIKPDEYIINLAAQLKLPHAQKIFDIHPRVRGGNAAKAFFNMVLGGLMAIFKPIVAPLAGIANAFLMLVKGVLYIIMLFTWFLKFCAWFFTEVLPSIPADIFGMVRFISTLLIDAVVGTVAYYFRKIFNAAGSTVVGAALTGWDNNPDESATGVSTGGNVTTADKFAETKKQQTENNNQPRLADKMDCAGRKCYKTEAGTVPWTVILATVLFPPSGVFMELGLHGWLQILVCLLLTFMFYFPGLIYALIILYC